MERREQGSLRDFAIGAVTQHFTKSLNRFVGHGLQAAQREPAGCHGSVSTVARSEGRLQPGEYHVHGRERQHRQRALHQRRARRSELHRNLQFLSYQRRRPRRHPGARDQNRNFNTNVEARDHPARNGSPDVLDPNFPFDGGFGQTPPNPNPRGIFGNSTFNTASVVEAADTAPFFHNNVERTLVDAVEFYSGDEFNAVPQAAAGFDFNDTQNGPDRRLPARHQHASEHRRRQARAAGNPRQQQQPA